MQKNRLLNLTAIAGLSLICGCGESSQPPSIPTTETEMPASEQQVQTVEVVEEQQTSSVEAFADMPENIDETNIVAQNLEDVLQQEIEDMDEEDIPDKA